MEDEIVSLRHITGVDSVHYSKEGYEQLASAIHETASVWNKFTAVSNVEGGKVEKKRP